MKKIWATTRVNRILLHANNKDADQPALPRSQISAFINHSLESRITKNGSCIIALFWLVYVAGQTGLRCSWRTSRRQVFSRRDPHWSHTTIKNVENCDKIALKHTRSATKTSENFTSIHNEAEVVPSNFIDL